MGNNLNYRGAAQGPAWFSPASFTCALPLHPFPDITSLQRHQQMMNGTSDVGAPLAPPPPPPPQEEDDGAMMGDSLDSVSAPSSSCSSMSPFPPPSSAAPQPLTSSTSSSIPPPTRCVLEDFTRCSESHLWKLMMSFYDRKGVESWSQGIVPHFITCNAFIGHSYAQVLQGYLRDCARKARENGPGFPLVLDPNEPLYIIELGAGSGKFSFFMLKALAEMRELLDFPFKKIVYVMTDFTQNNFKFWESHPGLRPYIEQGSLDLAIFDAVHDQVIHLAHAKKTLAPGTLKNPVCVVANYLFDTLCHDIFQVEGGVLKEGLISVGSKKGHEPDPLDPEIIKRFENRFMYREIGPDYYCPATGDGGGVVVDGGAATFGGSDETCFPSATAAANGRGESQGGGEDKEDAVHFRRILQWYQHHFGQCPSGASFLFPIGALRALRRLLALSGGRGLVVSGDKGNNHAEQFKGLVDPHIAVHGSFSVMVNYHAIGMYFISRGGFALHNPQEEASLKVSAFVLSGNDGIAEDEEEEEEEDDGQRRHCVIMSAPSTFTSTSSSVPSSPPSSYTSWVGPGVEAKGEDRARAFPALRASFYNAVDRFGPNDFFVMQKCMKEDSPNPTLKAVVALLKLGDWDPDVFYKFRDTILNQVPTSGQKLRNDLCRGIPRVWENYYMLDRDKDIAFEIGRFYYGIREYERALVYYLKSSEAIGEHHVTCHNMGLCHYSLGQHVEALECFQRSLSLNASYEKARSWQQKVMQEVNPSPVPSPLPSPPYLGQQQGDRGEKGGREGGLVTPEVENLSLEDRGGSVSSQNTSQGEGWREEV